MAALRSLKILIALATEVGKAQATSIREEAKQQMDNDDYELSDKQVRRVLFKEQVAQENGRAADITNKEMIHEHGPSSLQELGDLTDNFWDLAKNTALDVLGMARDGVANNGAGATIQNRNEYVEDYTDNLGIKP